MKTLPHLTSKADRALNAGRPPSAGLHKGQRTRVKALPLVRDFPRPEVAEPPAERDLRPTGAATAIRFTRGSPFSVHGHHQPRHLRTQTKFAAPRDAGGRCQAVQPAVARPGLCAKTDGGLDPPTSRNLPLPARLNPNLRLAAPRECPPAARHWSRCHATRRSTAGATDQPPSKGN